jgi:hypothetical protein
MVTIPQQIKEKRKQFGETQTVFGKRCGKSHTAVSSLSPARGDHYERSAFLARQMAA